MRLADRLIHTLPMTAPGLFNPYTNFCPYDLDDNGPSAKRLRLHWHLDCSPRFILCGEAPGYQGCRHTGIAFTSERLLMEGQIPRFARAGRLTGRPLPFSEPSATIVWRTLYRLGIEECTVLWNALQMHPYQPGNFNSNRTPTAEEIALGAPALHLLVEAFPEAKMIAVGKKAAGLLASMGIPVAATVRHPANGGATKFEEGIAECLGIHP